MKKLAEFLHSIIFTNNQLCDSKGYLVRFLDLPEKLDRSLLKNLDHNISYGICKLYNNLSKTDDIHELLTHLFYYLIKEHNQIFQSANETIMYNSCPEECDFGLLTFCEYSSDIWIRVHPEYFDSASYLYDSNEFPPIGGTIIGYDSNCYSYPVMSGELWYLLSNTYGSKDSAVKPDLIVPVSILKNVSFHSSWKVNNETSINCTESNHRDSGVLLDFESCIRKNTPFNYNLLSRNDVSAVGSYYYSNWIMLIPNNTVASWDALGDRCLMSIDQDSAFKIYQAKKRIVWLCQMLLFNHNY